MDMTAIRPEKISQLTRKMMESILKRSMEDVSSIYDYVRNIVKDVKQRGDEALLDANREFKRTITKRDLMATPEEIRKAYRKVAPSLVKALEKAATNIRRFHEAQVGREMWSIEVSPGIVAGRLRRAMDRVGCYIPGGRASYPSTVLMTVIPAKVAGVREVVVTTPAGKGMTVTPSALVAADLAGCDAVYKVGGPWGIAALANGTKTFPKVDKIVGPGNKYVTAAKMIVFGLVDIDSPAGPSEALILADESGNPGWIALDFLTQIEHDPDSSAVLVTPSKRLAERVCGLINRQYKSLPRKDILEASLKRRSHVLIVDDLEEAIDFTNQYAPEHLQILTRDPFITMNRIRHAGSIFLGPYAPVPAGDYASGTNHVLPTGQCARMFSGLSVDDFIKKPTFQYLSKEGLAGLRDTIVTLAESEGLPLHARSVEERFK
jgi:histidinol dehydrogenase